MYLQHTYSTYICATFLLSSINCELELTSSNFGEVMQEKFVKRSYAVSLCALQFDLWECAEYI